jgi:MarR family transcriptional regulator, exopolysaccharide II synthesis transcriptional activator
MILCAIGEDELTPAQLHERNPHAGTNSSYYLKQLTAAGHIERISSSRDKRATRVRLTPSGLHVCRELTEAAASYTRFPTHDLEKVRALEIKFQTLHRIELVWSNAARYGL